jgi:hypothetical protein
VFAVERDQRQVRPDRGETRPSSSTSCSRRPSPGRSPPSARSSCSS